MYGKLNEKKIRESDFQMSCEKARLQLDEYMNTEAKRVNVDSAKKRAVTQFMDYEGFRQMVLGANIFPTKSQQLYEFSKGGDKEQNVNKHFDEKKQIEREQLAKKELQQEQKLIKRRVQGKSQYHCNSFREFKKKFSNYYSKQLVQQKVSQAYKLVKEQTFQRLTKIFNEDCQANILVKITQVFEFVVKFMDEQKSQAILYQVLFMIKFYESVFDLGPMKDMGLMILTKKEKIKISEFILTLKDYKPEELAQSTQKLSSFIKK